jgi:hypothetical protein
MLTITTNNRPRDLVCLADLPAKARADFDYITGDDAYSPRLFAYRGRWYDANEFMRMTDVQAFRGEGRNAWDGYQSDTYFSGVLIRWRMKDISEDQVVVGTFYYTSSEGAE